MRKLFANDIIKRAKPITLPCPSLYFLINEDTIVYVGISIKPHSRIEQHTDKVFDKIFIYKCKSIEMSKTLETHYITTLKPKYNKAENEDWKLSIKPPKIKRTDYILLQETEYKNIKLFDNQYIKKGNGYIFRLNDIQGYIEGNILCINDQKYTLNGAIGQIIT